MVAYTTAPAAQAVTAILEGGWIPRWVAVFLIAGQARRREKLDNAFASRRRRRDDMPGFHDVIGRLLDDRYGRAFFAAAFFTADFFATFGTAFSAAFWQRRRAVCDESRLPARCSLIVLLAARTSASFPLRRGHIARGPLAHWSIAVNDNVAASPGSLVLEVEDGAFT